MPDGWISLPLFLATLQYVQGLPPNNIFTISASLPGMLILWAFFVPSYSHGWISADTIVYPRNRLAVGVSHSDKAHKRGFAHAPFGAILIRLG